MLVGGEGGKIETVSKQLISPDLPKQKFYILQQLSFPPKYKHYNDAPKGVITCSDSS